MRNDKIHNEIHTVKNDMGKILEETNLIFGEKIKSLVIDIVKKIGTPPLLHSEARIVETKAGILITGFSIFWDGITQSDSGSKFLDRYKKGRHDSETRPYRILRYAINLIKKVQVPNQLMIPLMKDFLKDGLEVTIEKWDRTTPDAKQTEYTGYPRVIRLPVEPVNV